MSSAEEDGSPGGRAKPSAPKKRRVALACDMCRKRKVSGIYCFIGVVPSAVRMLTRLAGLDSMYAHLGSRGASELSVDVRVYSGDGKQPKCTSCSTYNWDCSYVDAKKVRCRFTHVLDCDADLRARRNSSEGTLLVMNTRSGADSIHMRLDMLKRSRRRTGS